MEHDTDRDDDKFNLKGSNSSWINWLLINYYYSNSNILFLSRYTAEELHAMVDLKPEKKEDD